MRLLKHSVLLTLLCVYSQHSTAIDVGLYKKLRAESAQSPAGASLRVYVRGLQDGIEWSDTYLLGQGKPRLICPPNNIVLNVDNYLQFMDEALAAPRETPLEDKYPIAAVMIQSLQKKLPCPIKK